MVLYCLHMMYKYYYCLGFPTIEHNEEGKIIHNEAFKNIPHFIKTCLRVDFIKDGVVIYNDKIILHKRKVIPPITGYIYLWISIKKYIHH